MTDPRSLDVAAVVRRLERFLLWVDFGVGLSLTLGALVTAVRWRLRYGGYGTVREFMLHTAWSTGALLLIAGWAVLRDWRARWFLQLMPLVVPVVAAQWFLARIVAPLAR